ncbi:tellurite resistance protein [Rhodoferax ferrireducens]|uniref:Tellurite resistance protein n=1 Tax=Rhodoferax ferrireducens TaxID=192843 RepID=A0ABU2C5F6_9BURK|nr:TerB family tellurite resistance protein [Rhodoferax ferrireducens]MDR7376566.1 tellurite resistance protein [Rhodoferax ferrireducens]
MHNMPDQNLSPAQVALLTKAMLSVALVDGIHPAEAALIGQFYESSRSADMPTTAAIMADTASPFDAQAFLPSTDAFADTVVLMCLMTAYADGSLSSAEREHVQSIATTLGVSPARFEAHIAQVRDELVGALSHLPDTASVAAVVQELNAAG